MIFPSTKVDHVRLFVSKIFNVPSLSDSETNSFGLAHCAPSMSVESGTSVSSPVSTLRNRRSTGFLQRVKTNNLPSGDQLGARDPCPIFLMCVPSESIM